MNKQVSGSLHHYQGVGSWGFCWLEAASLLGSLWWLEC